MPKGAQAGPARNQGGSMKAPKLGLAVAVVAAMVLTACSSGTDSDDDGDSGERGSRGPSCGHLAGCQPGFS